MRRTCGVRPFVTRSSVLLFLLVAALGCKTHPDQVPYPEGYRSWTHVKSMVIEEGHPLYADFGGIHHVYANDAALKTLKQGGKYPDGAAFVFDLLEAKRAEGAVTEGARKVLGVMYKDTTSFAATGGWGFEGFKGSTRERVVKDARSACFSCHESQASRDYVFSTYRP